MRRIHLAAVALASTLVVLPAAASADSPTLHIRIQDHHGDDNLDLTIGGGFLAGLLRAFTPAHLKCDGESDPALRALVQDLERDGEGARGMARDEDGDLVRAHRHDGLVDLEVRGHDGDDADLTLPWTLARCLFVGGRVATDELAHALASGELRIVARDDGDEVRITLE